MYESSPPYIDPKLQEGTTPLVKMLHGKFTRTFLNFKYDQVSENDFTSKKRAILERVAIGGETLLFSICEIKAGEKPVSVATSCKVSFLSLRSALIFLPISNSIIGRYTLVRK